MCGQQPHVMLPSRSYPAMHWLRYVVGRDMRSLQSTTGFIVPQTPPASARASDMDDASSSKRRSARATAGMPCYCQCSLARRSSQLLPVLFKQIIIVSTADVGNQPSDHSAKETSNSQPETASAGGLGMDGTQRIRVLSPQHLDSLIPQPEFHRSPASPATLVCSPS